MILRRLADAISEQNWFTVVLEVLIVVVGIFVGLQVDDWNDARKEQALAQDYLSQLIADVEQEIADFDFSLEREVLKRDSLERLSAALSAYGGWRYERRAAPKRRTVPDRYTPVHYVWLAGGRGQHFDI